MDESDLLDFTPVPLRARRGGWTAARQRAFVAALAQGLKPGRAAARLGLSRQGAYALRADPRGAGFAAAWDAATAAARTRKAVLRAPDSYERAVTGLVRPIRYRGRILALERQVSDAAFRRLLAALDAHLAKRGVAGGDYFSPGPPKLCQEPPPDPACPQAPGRRPARPAPPPLLPSARRLLK